MIESIACLSCPEGRKRIAIKRGCCISCYEINMRAVRAGETTIEDLLVGGRMLASKDHRKCLQRTLYPS